MKDECVPDGNWCPPLPPPPPPSAATGVIDIMSIVLFMCLIAFRKNPTPLSYPCFQAVKWPLFSMLCKNPLCIRFLTLSFSISTRK